MLYFTVTYVNEQIYPLDLKNPYIQFICYVIEIDNHGYQMGFFNNKYTQVV